MLVMIIISCSKDKNSSSPEIINSWLLTERLADPGDGSGQYIPVENGNILVFYNDGTVTTEESFCGDSQSMMGMSGIYDEVEMKITPIDCNWQDLYISYHFEEDNLILSYPCIEPCFAKYIVIQ